MQSNFFSAALSYYGLAETNAKVEGMVDEGGPVLLLRVMLTDDDLVGIAGRVKAMQEQAPVEPSHVQSGVPSREQMREHYNALGSQERSQYGSFHNYCAAYGGEDLFQVRPTIELPAHVYLSPAEATEQQKVMAIGRDEKGNYAVAVEDLLPEQRKVFEEAVPSAVKARAVDIAGFLSADALRAECDQVVAARQRLNGTDGKPTSNADDFGGVPG